MERPRNVTIAIYLWCASFVIELIKGPVIESTTPVPPWIDFLGLILLALIGLILFKTLKGNNWARITLAIYFYIQLFLDLFPHVFLLFAAHLAHPSIYKIFSSYTILFIIINALRAYGIYLLFTEPSKDWFEKNKTLS